MPKRFKLLSAFLCTVATALTLVCLYADGLWAAPPPPPAPTQPAAPLPTEPEPTEPRTQIEYGQAPADPWTDYPDGIRIETLRKQNFTAHVMLIKDPSAVYLATSSNSFSLDNLGTRIPNQLRTEGAIAGINAGAFNDDGTSSDYIGSIPYGLVVSEGKILWDDGRSYHGFVGMDTENRLVVLDTIDRATVENLGIRDGCCFGPVLVKDGQINEKVYQKVDTLNARTAIGQLADGTVIFLCIDGRQCGSIGADYCDLLDIVAELGCVNACALDGGASTVMVYRDTYGRYGKPGQIVTCSSYSLFQASPRRMPTFFMVRPDEED